MYVYCILEQHVEKDGRKMIYRLQVFIIVRKWHSFGLEGLFSMLWKRISRKRYLLELLSVLLHKSSIYLNFGGGESGGSNKVKSRIAVSDQLLTYT